MKEEEYWNFGIQEVLCIIAGGILGALLSASLQLPPPWWLLTPLGSRSDSSSDWKWDVYVAEGGFDHFWLQSLWGWSLVGGVTGLVFSNVLLRGKPGLKP